MVPEPQILTENFNLIVTKNNSNTQMKIEIVPIKSIFFGFDFGLDFDEITGT